MIYLIHPMLGETIKKEIMKEITPTCFFFALFSMEFLLNRKDKSSGKKNLDTYSPFTFKMAKKKQRISRALYGNNSQLMLQASAKEAQY